MKADDLDKLFDDNEVDILQYFDLSSARHPNREQKRINVDMPQWVVDALDREATRAGVTRQSIIKLWLVERLDQQAAMRLKMATSARTIIAESESPSYEVGDDG